MLVVPPAGRSSEIARQRRPREDEYHPSVFAAVAALHSFLLLQSPPPACADAAACREAAVAAAATSGLRGVPRSGVAGRAEEPAKRSRTDVSPRTRAEPERPPGRCAGDAAAPRPDGRRDRREDERRLPRAFATCPDGRRSRRLMTDAGSSHGCHGPPAASAGSTPRRGRPDRRRTAAAPMEARRADDPGVVGEGADTMRLTAVRDRSRRPGVRQRLTPLRRRGRPRQQADRRRRGLQPCQRPDRRNVGGVRTPERR